MVKGTELRNLWCELQIADAFGESIFGTMKFRGANWPDRRKTDV